MGTTCDCVVVAGGCAVVGHVGDSRVYLHRGGKVYRLTEDHTLVAAQVKAGLITREEAAVSEWRSVLTHSVGVQESVEVDTLCVDCQPGDRLLLCSDGLHGVVTDDELASHLGAQPAAALPRVLVDLANERGGPDNVTAVVVGFAAAPDATADASAMIEVLRRIPLFAGLTYKEQAAVLGVANARKYPAGAEIVREGERGDELFIVARGRVAVEKDGIAIGELGPGGHFGEMGLVDDVPRSATVRALELVRILSIGRGPMMALMRKEPRLAVKLLWSFVQTMADRLRAANHEIVEARQELSLARSEAPAPFIVVEE
jgi:hypothetical protein